MANVHASYGPVTPSPITSSVFDIVCAPVEWRPGEFANTMHVVPRTGYTNMNINVFLRHLGGLDTEQCFYQQNRASVCFELPKDSDAAGFGLTLDAVASQVNQAIGVVRPMGVDIVPDADEKRLIAVGPEGSVRPVSGHIAAMVTHGEERADDQDQMTFGLRCVAGQLERPNHIAWTVHVEPSYGELPAGSDRALWFLGYRRHEGCQFLGGRSCHWRTLFGGDDLQLRSRAQAHLEQHRGNLRLAISLLVNAYERARSYRLRLLPTPEGPSAAEVALQDPARTFLFLDTNMLIHGKWIREVDWPSVAGTPKSTLVAATTVLDELQKIEYDVRRTQRARKRSKMMTQLLIDLGDAIYRFPGAELRQGVDLAVLTATPQPSQDDGYDPDHQDDRLHWEVDQFADSARNVVLLTHDRGMYVRARGRRLPVKLADDSLMLDPEPDARDRDIAALRAEIEGCERKYVRSAQLWITRHRRSRSSRPYAKRTDTPAAPRGGCRLNEALAAQTTTTWLCA